MKAGSAEVPGSGTSGAAFHDRESFAVHATIPLHEERFFGLPGLAAAESGHRPQPVRADADPQKSQPRSRSLPPSRASPVDPRIALPPSQQPS
jgi:hypothetical protein